MDDQVTEICSIINDINLTNKALLKRLNKVIDDGGQECTCHCESESMESDIRELQFNMKRLEDKVNKRDENCLNKDFSVLKERLDVIERELKDSDVAVANSNNTTRNKRPYHHRNPEDKHREKKISQNGDGVAMSLNLKHQATKKQTKTDSVSVNASKSTQTSEKCDDKKPKDKTLLANKTKTVEMLIGNVSKEPEIKSEILDKQSSDVRNKKNIKSNTAIRKPNFVTSKQLEVLKQDTILVHDGERHWRSVAQNELEEYRSRYMFLKGVHSVICLDISASMAHSNAWTEARTFITEYLAGLENVSKTHSSEIKTEYVALVTFGHQTKIQVGYTENFKEIEEELDKTKLGGPTQMYGGILMALAAAWCSTHQIESLDNNSNVFTKIILISDGRPTEDDLISGPDIADSSKVDETKAKILQEMEQFRKNHKDLFFVPVGNSDKDFHTTMAEFSGGFVLNFKQGMRLAKRQYLTSRLLDPLGLVAGLTLRDSDNDLTREDMEDLTMIQSSANRHRVEISIPGNNPGRDVYHETRSKTLPQIGSRVRRGPDWHYKMQDSNGPGTVIGQTDDDHHVWVEWDVNAHQNVYSYGPHGYDVLIVDEPRKLYPGEKIAVGCKVEPGKDWRNTDYSVSVGVVIKVNKAKKKAKVRWSNGKRESYSYDELQEIQVKTDGATSGAQSQVKDDASGQEYGLEPPKAMTIEEFAAKQDRKKNKNFK